MVRRPSHKLVKDLLLMQEAASTLSVSAALSKTASYAGIGTRALQNSVVAGGHAALATDATDGGSAQLQAIVEQQRQQILALRQEIEQSRRMATLGELTSTTTHEFNNLLMTMLNYAKLGLRHKDEPTRDKAFQRILDAANRASKVTSSVLAMARNRTGQMEPTDLKQLIEDTLLLIEREFRRFRVQLECALEQVPQVNGSGNELQRVLVNLLVNARQATPEGGNVRISLKHNVDSNEVLLTIRDSGAGIPPDVLPRIFEPFFTTKSGPDATGKGGTGVGLSSCKESIDAHAGRIRVESTVGKGTAFIIRLPALATEIPYRNEL